MRSKAHLSFCHVLQVYREIVEGLACCANDCELHWVCSGKLLKASEIRRRAMLIWPVVSGR